MNKILKKEIIVISGDFNGRIHMHLIPECICLNGEHVINHNVTALRDFCALSMPKITNPFYRHKKVHKFTREAKGTMSIINSIIMYILGQQDNSINIQTVYTTATTQTHFTITTK
jgi:hypothetical protein